MISRKSFNVSDTLGIGCLRQTAGFPFGTDNKFQYVCPLGPSICIWDIAKKRKIFSKQFAEDLITILIKNQVRDLVLMISYSGEGKLFNSELLPICEFDVQGSNVIYASWSKDGKMFGVCTIGRQSSLSLFEVTADNISVSLKFSARASDLCRDPAVEPGDHAGLSNTEGGESLDNSNSECRNKKLDVINSYYGSIFSDDDTILAIYHRAKCPFEVHIYNLDGKVLKKQPISPLGEKTTSMICLSECKNGRFAIGLQRGIFVLLNSSTLEVLSVFQSQGSAQVCIWDGELLLTAAYQSGMLQWWNDSAEIIKEVKIEDVDSVIHLNWSILGKELWIGGITSLTYSFVETEAKPNGLVSPTLQSMSLIEHKVAGCGLCFGENPVLATGDLAGNVFINQMGTDFSFMEMRRRIDVKSSVRCLAWVEDTLFIGTLEGQLYKWSPDFKDSEVTHNLAYSFQFGVLCMKKSNANSQLAIGTGGGDLYIFDAKNNFELILEKRVHKPQNVSMASESQCMEIWSIAWEPSDELIATASEDRTSIISNAINGMICAICVEF